MRKSESEGAESEKDSQWLPGMAPEEPDDIESLLDDETASTEVEAPPRTT